MINILDRFLGQVARLMVARGILFPEFAERMKAHYVEAARGLTEGKITDSRLSLATGLQRRDIARLKNFQGRPERATHLSRLVALWLNDPDYAPGGAPRALPRAGPAPSFEALAARVRRDVHPRSMLETLIAAGTVGLDADGETTTLAAHSFQPLAGSEDQLDYLSANLGDHLSAATDNVLGAAPPWFERAVHYTALTGDQIDTLRSFHARGQMALLEDLSRQAAAMKADAVDDPDARHRFRAGAYFFGTDEGPV
ncbi:MAG: DUF6502 family protein [Pseudomonadota bacterium]